MCRKRQPHVVQLAPERQLLTESLHSSCLLLAGAPIPPQCALEWCYASVTWVLPVILAIARECKCKRQASQGLCQVHNEPTQPVMSWV